jgi:hypothetical protein
MSLLHRDRKMVEAVSEKGEFSTLLSSLRTADLESALDGPGPFTLFAPTDAAFRKLPAGTVEQLLSDRAAMRRVLQHHVVPGRITSKDALTTHSVRSMDGEELKIDTCQGMAISGAKVVESDIIARNGVIHAIDTVLMPSMAGPVTGATGVGARQGMSTETKAAAGAAGAAGAGAAAVGAAKAKYGGEKDVSTTRSTVTERTVEGGREMKEKVTGRERMPAEQKIVSESRPIEERATGAGRGMKEQIPGREKAASERVLECGREVKGELPSKKKVSGERGIEERAVGTGRETREEFAGRERIPGEERVTGGARSAEERTRETGRGIKEEVTGRERVSETTSRAGESVTGKVSSAASSVKEKTTEAFREPGATSREVTGTVREKLTSAADKLTGREKMGAGAGAAGAAGTAIGATNERIPGLGGKDISRSAEDELRRLESLRDNGEISEAEFQTRKRDLLNR